MSTTISYRTLILEMGEKAVLEPREVIVQQQYVSSGIDLGVRVLIAAYFYG